MSSLPRTGFNSGHKIWLCPHSHLSEKLAEILTKEGQIVRGFLDRNKSGRNIVNYENFNLNNDEVIVLISPNHALSIYQTLVNLEVPPGKIYLYEYVSNSAQQFKPCAATLLKAKSIAKAFGLRLSDRIISSLKLLVCNHKKALLISPGFVDLNIKDLYINLENHTAIEPRIASDNKRQLKQLKRAGFRTTKINSPEFLFYSLQAFIKILDHNPTSIWQSLALKNSFTVQIWHGIPLKKIGHLSNYKQQTYNLVVSTSSFVSDYAFKALFKAKSLIESGYPRNDILTEHSELHTKMKLALVNHSIYSWLITESRKFMVYMPTWRQPGSTKNPLDLEELNLFAKERGLILVIKNHPFIRPDSFYDCLSKHLDARRFQFRKGFSENLLFYPSTDDIYPLLAHSQALITDYSSVYFDYLLVNKPLIFFCYDRKEYENRHGEFMLDFDAFTPGEKPNNIQDLKKAIIRVQTEDTYHNARTELRRRIFNEENIGHSGEKLASAIAEQSDLLLQTLQIEPA